MSIEETYDEFTRGERQALLRVRSFITKHGVREVDAYCAQRLHDIMMDNRAPRANVGIPTGTMSECPLDTDPKT
jgi:hypothetical protein